MDRTVDSVVYVRPAPLLRRVFAGVVDGAIEGGVALCAAIVWLGLVPADLPPRYWNQFDYLVDVVNVRPGELLAPCLVGAGALVVWESAFGALIGFTPVGRLVGLRLCLRSGRRPGFFRLALRSIVRLVFTVTAFAGPAVALVSRKNRALHDMISGCFVLATSRDTGGGRVSGALERPREDGPRPAPDDIHGATTTVFPAERGER